MRVVIGLISFLVITQVRSQNEPNAPEDRPIRRTRVMYIAAVEEDWDYAPDGGPDNDFANRFLMPSRDPIRIGRIYRKALFREFTDNSFRIRTVRPPWLGILGPIVIGEVGDLVIIHFFNQASFPMSLHPHGLRYRKRHEGALYEDNTTGIDKMDDRVPPNTRYEYRWFIIPEDAPAALDSNCISWVYHSHRNADTDLHAGLLGPLVVCRPGTLTSSNLPKGIDKMIPLVFLAFDENESELLNANIARIAPELSEQEMDALKQNPGFRTSNLMFSINGLSYNNLRGLDVCAGDRVSWLMIGVGNEIDVHSIIIEGQILTLLKHRTDTINLFPAKFTTSFMTAKQPGSFSIRCEVGRHTDAGMEAHLLTRDCYRFSRAKNAVRPGKVRKYYIAAEEVLWNYGPTGFNVFNGEKLTEDMFASTYFIRGPRTIGGKYKKVIYREYTDESFKRRKKRSPREVHLALQGPTIRAEIGDTVEIIFFNKARLNYSIYTHGAFHSNPKNQPMANMGIRPGQKRIYRWFVPKEYGPTELDPPCLTWRYFSSVNFVFDFYDGLHGTFLTCKRGTLNNHGRQKFVDREFSLLFAVLDENDSHYIRENIRAFATQHNTVNMSDPDFRESNQMHSINGRTYGNLEGLRMCKGDTISWHIVAFGKSIDLHVAYFHGNTFIQHGMFRDTLAVVPSAHHTVTMNADNPGEWALDCRTNNHLMGGMRAIYRVDECESSSDELFWPVPNKFPTKARVYYIGAVEEEWNYAPLDRHIITGESLLDNRESRPYVLNSDNRIGKIYKKTVYREFTDSTFMQQKKRTPEEQHLGFLGPMIKAEVGDTIRVIFKNFASRPYSIHPHGVVYRNIEGDPLRAMDRGEAPVLPGEMYVYEWNVPPRSGPGPSGFNCTTWAYYSAIDPIRDTNTGLIGPLVTCRKGVLTESGKRKDVDREFAVLFTILDENESWLLNENIRTYAGRPDSVNVDDSDFQQSNRKYSINGRIYGSLSGLEAYPFQSTAWYMMGMGSELDMHTAHFHGQTFLQKLEKERRGDVVDLFPGVFETVQIRTDNPGTWFLHCHVDDHMKFGMNAVFTVKPYPK